MRLISIDLLQVRAPKFMLRGQIDNFVKKNHAWIEKQRSALSERQDTNNYYLGEITRQFDAVSVQIAQQGYKKLAREYLQERVPYFAKKFGFSYNSLRITSAKTRWGSCSSRGTLSFSYRLIMAPKYCVDYVIIHELCHLREMNHSKKFWSLVEKYFPDYKKAEQHLKSEGWRYSLDLI